MAFVIWSRRGMARQRVRFVEARTVRMVALAGVLALVLAALALGVAIGASSSRDTAAGAELLNVRRSYEIDQLGKVSSTLGTLEPRVAQLSAQVKELAGFERQLAAMGRPDAGGIHDVPPLPDLQDAPPLDSAGGPATPPRELFLPGSIGEPGPHASLRGSASTPEAAGGPELPPLPCHAERAASGRRQGAQAVIDCFDTTLAQLQNVVAAHYAAYMAFPGRDPSPGARHGSPFGNRTDPFTGHLNFHPGVDLVAPSGTPILATAGGRVIQCGPHGGYGNAVEIRHGNGLVTRYGHTSKIFVQVGDLVMPGQKIAEVGSTGRSTGPHLHFEVIVEGAQVDPMPYLALFASRPDAPG